MRRNYILVTLKGQRVNQTYKLPLISMQITQNYLNMSHHFLEQVLFQTLEVRLAISHKIMFNNP